MSKFCGKCGLEMADDDFLCPKCGAIWGDRIYHSPTEVVAVNEDPEVEQEGTQTPLEDVKKPQRKNQPRWLLPLASAALIIGFVLFWFGSDRDMWAGEGSTSPSTTDYATIGQVPATKPPASEPGYVTYKVKFVDPGGNPVANVSVAYPNLDLGATVVYLEAISDENGLVTFDYPSVGQPQIRIVEIPEGYTILIISGSGTFTFFDDATDMIITLYPVDTFLPRDDASYSIEMLDPDWLHEELKTPYPAGEVVNVKIQRTTANVAYMLLMNGQEIPATPLDGGSYLLYSFTMPEEDVVLDLKIIADRTYEGIIRDYYTQYPDAEQVEVLNYYGQYGVADVVMLKLKPLDSHPFSSSLNGYIFEYANQNRIQVLADGKFISLSQAYFLGYLTDEDIEEILRLHMEYFPELYMEEIEPI